MEASPPESGEKSPDGAEDEGEVEPDVEETKNNPNCWASSNSNREPSNFSVSDQFLVYLLLFFISFWNISNFCHLFYSNRGINVVDLVLHKIIAKIFCHKVNNFFCEIDFQMSGIILINLEKYLYKIFLQHKVLKHSMMIWLEIWLQHWKELVEFWNNVKRVSMPVPIGIRVFNFTKNYRSYWCFCEKRMIYYFFHEIF